MQGSVAVSHSPVIMESLVFRQKLGLSLSTSGIQPLAPCHATARCLFGAPDPKQAKDLVKEVELKTALSFGKRFNFDIVNGEPFPNSKKMKLSHPAPESVDSDEENVAVDEEETDDGYEWSETYDEDYMAKCNKHVANTSIVGPNRHAVSLFIAPIVPNLVIPSAVYPPSPFSSSSTAALHLPKSRLSVEPSQKSESSSLSSSTVVPLPLSPPSLSNNENNNNDPKKVAVQQGEEKTRNRLNRIHHNHPPSAKKTLSALTKYTNRVLKHAAMKKPRKSIITDYLQVKRRKALAAGQNEKK